MYEWIDATENNKCIIAVFMDLRRAFETVSRNGLLEKLKKYGFSQRSYYWMKSYLSYRWQKTKIGDKTSSLICVQQGLPQGSRLSNLLFVLFVNDLPHQMRDVKINLFADDALVYIAGNNPLEMSIKMNENLAEFHEWLKFNQMSLNTSKCNTLIINENANNLPDIRINDEVIENKNCVKCLRVCLRVFGLMINSALWTTLKN